MFELSPVWLPPFCWLIYNKTRNDLDFSFLLFFCLCFPFKKPGIVRLIGMCALNHNTFNVQTIENKQRAYIVDELKIISYIHWIYMLSSFYTSVIKITNFNRITFKIVQILFITTEKKMFFFLFFLLSHTIHVNAHTNSISVLNFIPFCSCAWYNPISCFC